MKMKGKRKEIEMIETLKKKKFRWGLLRRMYGCPHSSIIGFISSEWIRLSKDNQVIDGAPSAKTGEGIKGQKVADILLCRKNRPFGVVEIESGVSNYKAKIGSILKYFRNKKDFNGLEFGLLIMTNAYYYGSKKEKRKYRQYGHNWSILESKVTKENIVLFL